MTEITRKPGQGIPRIDAQHMLSWRSAAWWANPTVLSLFIVVPFVLIPFFVPAHDFWQLWRVPKALDEGLLVVAVASLGGLLLGAMASLLRKGVGGPVAFSHVDLTYVASKAPMLFVITLAAYAAWFGIGLVRGADIGGTLVSIFSGGATNFDAIKEPLAPIAGVTSFMQVGVVAASVYVLRIKMGIPRSSWPLVVIILLSTVRAILYAERLAFLEVVSAAILTYACVRRGWQEGSSAGGGFVSNVLVRVLPAFAPFALAILFGLTEATRSWALYYSRTGTSFADFALSRLGGYYATAVNNSALLLHSFPTEHIPFYSVAWFWNLPGVDEFLPYAIAPADPTQTWIPFLEQRANPEYNNVGMLSVVWDVGPVFAPLIFFSFGLAMAIIYRRARAGSVVALVSFASLAISIMELPRYFYIGEGRATPVILACLLLAGGLRRFRQRRNRDSDLRSSSTPADMPRTEERHVLDQRPLVVTQPSPSSSRYERTGDT